MKDARRQDIAADHGQGSMAPPRAWASRRCARSVLQRLGHRLAVDDAVALGVFRRHLLHADHRTAVVVIDIRHLLHHRRIAVEQVVGQQHGEGLVADRRIGAEYRMTEAQGLGLADVDAVDVLRHHVAHELQQFGLAALLQFAFKFVGLVEMVLDRPLGTAGDEDHVGNAGRNRLLHRILDQRLVHDRHHLLRTGLGGGQEAGAHAGNWEYGFGNFLHLKPPCSKIGCNHSTRPLAGRRPGEQIPELHLVLEDRTRPSPAPAPCPASNRLRRRPPRT
jgi:hypothetical protein